MRDSNKNKMGGVNSRFTSSESEIVRMQEVAVQENTKKAMKSGLKVFKGEKNFLTIDFRAVSGHVLGIYIFRQFSKSDRQVAPHPAMAKMNNAGFIGRSIKCYSTQHLHVVV